jgi:hypothetical protein
VDAAVDEEFFVEEIGALREVGRVDFGGRGLGGQGGDEES